MARWRGVVRFAWAIPFAGRTERLLEEVVADRERALGAAYRKKSIYLPRPLDPHVTSGIMDPIGAGKVLARVDGECQMVLKIGELARRVGVTVRTLRYYDEIGLLCPRARTECGYRLYGREEIVRLQQILSFRALGFGVP